MTTATLATLNENDNAAELGGIRLGNDGQGNELWQFGDKVANRWYDGEAAAPVWSDDVTGWNYEAADALA